MRRVLIAVLVAGAFAAPAAASSQTLMPAVTYSRQVVFTPRGAVAIHVLTAPKPGGLWELRPVLSNGVIVGRERVTDMEKDVSSMATVAGVNGDFANAYDGTRGILIEGGVLKNPPYAARSSIGISGSGSLDVRRVEFYGIWQGLGQRRPLTDLNEPPNASGVSLFTPAWGPRTPAMPDATEAVVAPFPSAAPNTDLVGPVVQIDHGGGTTIPPGGAVLAARGASAQKLAAEAPVGARMFVRLSLKPDWSAVVDAVGGGPLLVRRGKPVFRSFEDFTPSLLAARDARTAVGQRKDGKIVLVAVDGRQPGYSVGLTNFELAQTLAGLGCVTAAALEPGRATTMAFDGQLLNQPYDPTGERAVAEALLVYYYGVYAPPPAVDVLSPNGDGVDETQSLSYKIVRPSTVTATLVGPDGAARYTDSGAKVAGTYRLTWPGLTAGGAPEAEGRWTWRITAVDDLGRASSDVRTFWLNDTLGFLRVPPTAFVRPRRRFVVADFKLAHAARVTVRVETATGVPIKTLLSARVALGDRTVTWDGRNVAKRLVYGGRYVIDVVAQNGYGPAELTGALTVRRG